MSTMAADTSKGRRARRQFSEEFKAQTVRLVLEEGKSIGAVAESDTRFHYFRESFSASKRARRFHRSALAAALSLRRSLVASDVHSR